MACHDRRRRTTVTLDPDVELPIKRAMKERGLSFKQAVNGAIRAGAESQSPSVETYDMGEPTVDVSKALLLAGELEHQELAQDLRGYGTGGNPRQRCS